MMTNKTETRRLDLMKNLSFSESFMDANIRKKTRVFSGILRLLTFVVFVAFLTVGAHRAEAQLLMEFTWTLENVNYEGLLYVPDRTPPSMLVRVLEEDGTLNSLILERVQMMEEENGVYRFQCMNPKILYGDTNRQHQPESFRAQDDVPGKVSNGKEEALYEIVVVNNSNIETIMKKYLVEEIEKENQKK